MIGFRHDRYGGAQVITRRDLPVPSPGPGQVRVAIEATGLNASDTEFMRGRPAYARVAGLLRPKIGVLGSDIAGTVDAVGPGVSDVSIGDAVFGDVFDTRGGLAEFTVAPADKLIPRPPALDAITAAALPQAGSIALQGTAGITAGMRVAINGGGGGAGSLAIQLAKAAGAEVWGIDAGRKCDHMAAMGADHVLDYRQADYTAGPQRFDRILDLFATRGILARRRALAAGGRYQVVGGWLWPLVSTLIIGGPASLVTSRASTILALAQSRARQSDMAARVIAGAITVPVDRTFDLEDTPAAMAYQDSGGVCGKVVVINPRRATDRGQTPPVG